MRLNQSSKITLLVLVATFAGLATFATMREQRPASERVERKTDDEIRLITFEYPGKTTISFQHPAFWRYYGSQDSGSGSIGLFYREQDSLAAQFWIGAFDPTPLQYRPVSEKISNVKTNTGLTGRVVIKTFPPTDAGSAPSGTEYWFIHETGIEDVSFYLRVLNQEPAFEPVFMRMLNSLKVDASWRLKPSPRGSEG